MTLSGTADLAGNWQSNSLAATPGSRSGRRGWPPAPVTVLLATLVTPWLFSFGSLAVSPYRVVLLVLLIPCLVRWLSGKAGRIIAADILLVLYCLWCVLAIAAVHGAEMALESGGMLFIETIGGYLVARCYIRDIEDFRAIAKLLLVIVLLLLPLAIAEAVTGQKWTLHLFRTLGPTIADGYTEPRWGLTRVQGPFDHPILFGVFAGAPLALVYLGLGPRVPHPQRLLMAALVAVTAILCLSSGPMVAVLVQIGLLTWDRVLRNIAARWRILWVLVTVSYLALELPTTQTVPQILTRFAFDQWTAFYRTLIFDYGWRSVMVHPLFGTGFDDWLHPSWMSSSIDMFWLVPAVRHGMPAGALLLATFFAAAVGVGFCRGLGEAEVRCRTAYLTFMTAFFLAGWTVHFWNATYVLFMFLLGSGIWLCDPRSALDSAAEEMPSARRRPVPLTRVRPRQTGIGRPVRPYARGLR